MTIDLYDKEQSKHTTDTPNKEKITVTIAIWYTCEQSIFLFSILQLNKFYISIQVAPQLSSRGWVDP
jgi:hypothetical protein